MTDYRGTARIESKLFERLLGDTAMQVWCFLVQLRKYAQVQGHLPPVVFPSRGGIMHAKGYSPLKVDAVKRALVRLRRAGLVRDVGYVMKPWRGQLREVFVREVFGERVGPETVFVPTDISPRVLALGTGGHGGRRRGSGRKQSTAPSSDSNGLPVYKKPRKSTAPSSDSEPLVDPTHGAVEKEKTESTAPTPDFSTAPRNRSRSTTGNGLVPSLRSGTAAPQKPGAAASSDSSKDPPPKKVLTLVPDPPPRAPPKFDSLTARFQKQAEWALKHRTKPAVNYGSLGMPMWPPSRALGYTIMCPPRVSLAKEREDQLKFCVKWYRSAVESRLGRCHPIQLGGSTRRYFEDALDVFLEHEIRPGAWVAWALDRILLKLPTHARKRFTPQVKILLSPKTLTESRWAYREAEPDYATPWFRPTDEGTHLLWRLRGLEADVFRLEERTEANVLALLALHFPEGYPVALRLTREKSEQLEQEVLARVQLGHWVWPIPHRELRRVG